MIRRTLSAFRKRPPSCPARTAKCPSKCLPAWCITRAKALDERGGGMSATTLRPDCWTDTATPRPWKAKDIAMAKIQARRGLPLDVSDDARFCRAWINRRDLETGPGRGCAGCARLPEGDR